MENKSTIKKNQKAEIPTKNGGKYSYKYVDIAQIHNYLEENKMSYYQYTERIEGDDYIMTVRIIDGNEKPALRGSKIVDATLFGNDNPAQKQGSALTYARRYSLLLAFGLATEDDDAQSLYADKTKEIVATEKQINMIKQLLTDEELDKTKAKYGEDLEKLNIQMASKIISSKKEEI